jgi:two-component system, response regulator PdtaR
LSRLDLVDTLGTLDIASLKPEMRTQAWVLFEKTKIAAVVTDIDMPGSMDGMELARRVLKRWPDCRIVVIRDATGQTLRAFPTTRSF